MLVLPRDLTIGRRSSFYLVLLLEPAFLFCLHAAFEITGHRVIRGYLNFCRMTKINEQVMSFRWMTSFFRFNQVTLIHAVVVCHSLTKQNVVSFYSLWKCCQNKFTILSMDIPITLWLALISLHLREQSERCACSIILFINHQTAEWLGMVCPTSEGFLCKPFTTDSCCWKY